MSGIDLLGEHNQFILTDRILPVFAFKDEDRLIARRNVNGYKHVDLVADSANCHYLFAFDEEALLLQRR